MRQLAAFGALSAADRRLLASAFALNILVRLALPFRSLDRLRAWAGQSGSGHRPLDRIVWAGRAAARRMPGATCLSSALALQRLLSGNGHESELHIGVTRKEGAFFAHAWVEHQGRILIGEDDERTYTRLASWTVASALRRERAGGSDGA